MGYTVIDYVVHVVALLGKILGKTTSVKFHSEGVLLISNKVIGTRIIRPTTTTQENYLSRKNSARDIFKMKLSGRIESCWLLLFNK